VATTFSPKKKRKGYKYVMHKERSEKKYSIMNQTQGIPSYIEKED